MCGKSKIFGKCRELRGETKKIFLERFSYKIKRQTKQKFSVLENTEKHTKILGKG